MVDRGQPGQWGTEPWSTQPDTASRVREMARGELWLSGADAALIVGDAPPYVAPAQVPELYVVLLIARRSRAGDGLGAQLLLHAERLARERAAEQLRVDCYAGVPGLVAFYERQGFERAEPFTVNGWPGQVLVKPL